VKRIGKILVISLGTLAVLFIAGVWMLNRWLESPAMRTRIERELSKAVRVPLKFSALSISPWGGISASEVTVPAAKGNFFEASKFTAKYSLSALLGGRLVFSEINVDGPKFVITQSADGKWEAPPLPADLQAELDAKKKPKAPKVKADKSAPATPKPAATPKPKNTADVVVGKLNIVGGAAELYDQTGAPFATLSDIRLLLPGITEDKIEGMLSVGYAVLYGKLAMRELRMGVSHSEQKGFICPNYSAVIGGGKISGGFATLPERATELGLPYSGKIVASDVDIVQACTEASAEPPNLTGILSANIIIKGVGDLKKELKIKGDIQLKKGTFRELEMIRQLGEFLSLEDVAKFGIDEAALTFDLAMERISIQPLTINAPPLVVSATGTSKLDGKMKLAAVLAVEDGFLEKRAAIASQFSAPDASGRRNLAFDVTGTWTKPKSDLLEKVTGTTDKTTQKIIVGESVLRKAIEEVKAAAEEQKKEEKKK
jgi:hypothetical protein